MNSLCPGPRGSGLGPPAATQALGSVPCPPAHSRGTRCSHPSPPATPQEPGTAALCGHAVPELPPPQLKPLPCSWPVCALLRRAVQREAVHRFHRQKEVLCPYRFGPYRPSPVACAGAGQHTATSKEDSPSSHGPEAPDMARAGLGLRRHMLAGHLVGAPLRASSSARARNPQAHRLECLRGGFSQRVCSGLQDERQTDRWRDGRFPHGPQLDRISRNGIPRLPGKTGVSTGHAMAVNSASLLRLGMMDSIT